MAAYTRVYTVVFVSRDFEIGTNISCEELTVSSRTGLIFKISSSCAKVAPILMICTSHDVFLCKTVIRFFYLGGQNPKTHKRRPEWAFSSHYIPRGSFVTGHFQNEGHFSTIFLHFLINNIFKSLI